MYAQHVLSGLLLAACVMSGPITQAKERQVQRSVSADNVCVLIDGDNPYVLDPFNRPQCACDCIKEACAQVSYPTSVFRLKLTCLVRVV
ncbi:hypothetical protein F5Y05DRAFT_286897 [Hypoxylon sp. FL0543]|nr:hypothetical protein F5Y05DRAFT_286897 [Hypoxylon sp. FL0543]